MKSNKDLLGSTLKTAQMGQIGIHSVLKIPLRTDLQSALREQHRQYSNIERQAQMIASARGWEMEELPLGTVSMTNAMVRMKLAFGNRDSKAAEMMIQGSTKGIIKSAKNLHAYRSSDESINNLCQKLLDHERENIRILQEYL